MDPALITGPNGAIVCLAIAVVYLYRENTKLREASMDLLKKYQDRDDEERKWRMEREREREREREQPGGAHD